MLQTTRRFNFTCDPDLLIPARYTVVKVHDWQPVITYRARARRRAFVNGLQVLSLRLFILTVVVVLALDVFCIL